MSDAPLSNDHRFHRYRVIPTTPEVYAVIRSRHGVDMEVFSSFSDPSGTFNGGPGIEGRMETMWGIKGADYPLIAARSTWSISYRPDGTQAPSRDREVHEYFIVIPEKESE